MSDNIELESLPQIEEEIRRFESGRIHSLRYSAPLRRRFHTDTCESRGRMLFVQGLLSLLAYDCFIVGDYLMAPQNVLRAIVIRFAIITPLVLLIAFLVKDSRREVVQEGAAALLCMLGAASVLCIHYGVSGIVTAQAQTGLIMVLLAANCVLRLDLPYAAATTVAVALMHVLWTAADQKLTYAEKWISCGMLFWVGVLTLVANYTLTRERRFSYLLQLRGRLQRNLLAHANAELMALSETDRLTGLPNRRAYDARLVDLWSISQDQSQPISAIMVDVDHFKRLNDTHGHPYGDRVLQRVGSLLQQALRSDEDFVARYGGEEFVVLLPNTPSEVAVKIAERIRTLVQVAGSPAVQREAGIPSQLWATVSCGVATCFPSMTSDYSRLIADADAAMYRAKKEGRNRVCWAAPQVPPATKLTFFPSSSSRN